MPALTLILLARLVHFATAMLLFGTALFPVYAGQGGSDASLQAEGRARARISAVAGLLALLSGLGWVAASFADIAGDPAALVDPDTLSAFFLDTSFGQAWLVRLVLLAALAAVALAAPRRHGLVASLGALNLVSLAFIGHSAQAVGAAGAVAKATHAIHLIAAAAWLGGLLPLALRLARAPAERAIAALRRFSEMGMVAVALILMTGMVKASGALGPVDAMLSSDYGRTFLVKIGLVALMILIAATNRFVLMPKLRRRPSRMSLRPLGALVLIEIALALLVIGAAALLGMLPQPGHAVSV